MTLVERYLEENVNEIFLIGKFQNLLKMEIHQV
jgi:hypothetical protein